MICRFRVQSYWFQFVLPLAACYGLPQHTATCCCLLLCVWRSVTHVASFVATVACTFQTRGPSEATLIEPCTFQCQCGWTHQTRAHNEEHSCQCFLAVPSALTTPPGRPETARACPCGGPCRVLTAAPRPERPAALRAASWRQVAAAHSHDPHGKGVRGVGTGKRVAAHSLETWPRCL